MNTFSCLMRTDGRLVCFTVLSTVSFCPVQSSFVFSCSGLWSTLYPLPALKISLLWHCSKCVFCFCVYVFVTRTLIYGDKKAGFTVFWADDGLDTGPILLQRECAVEPNDTVDTLYNRFLFPEGIKAMVTTWTLTTLDDMRSVIGRWNHFQME